MIDLKSAIIKKEIPENKNANKIADIVEQILDFNKQQKVKGIKRLTLKQMLQRLPIAQVIAGNAYENLLNEIHQIIYSLYREKEVTKKVYNNIMNSIDTIFMDCRNIKSSDPHRLLLNLLDKTNLQRSDKYVAL